MATKKETIDSKDVESKIAELREKMRTMRFSLAGSRTKNVKEQKTLRREIARLETARTASKA